jgi:hypothetical protein
MERVFRSKEVWAAGVALLVAVAAVFGFQLDGEALLAALAVLAGAAGALGGALTRAPTAEPASRNFFLDQWAEAGGQVHAQAMEQSFIYPDDEEDDSPVHVTDVVVELTEQMAVMRERVEKMEAALDRMTGDL